MKSTIFALTLALALACPAAGQQPRLENARLETRAVSGGLEHDFRSLVAATSGPAWIGYGAGIVPGEHNMCCYSSSSGCCGGCRLEGGSSGNVGTPGESKVRLEGPRSLWVLFRVEQKRVEKIRAFTEDCLLDAGGLQFYWLTGVRPDESVELLATFAAGAGQDAREERRLGDSAVAAIAFHADAAADRALERFVESGQPETLRERAAFWLGNLRGRRGYEVLRRLASADPSERVREKVVFALTQSKEPEAVTTMIDVARGDRSGRVRGQALFWLAHKAGEKARATISDAIDKDPETEVKTRAVFALSQLPPDEGVPLLIQVARANRNPEVRKKAMFWLGQSKDARALKFFEEILTR